MALKKSDLRGILKNENSTDEEKITEILNMLHDEVDAVKDSRDELQNKLDEAIKAKESKETGANNELEALQKKLNDVVAEYEAYKTKQNDIEVRNNKEKAFRKVLEDLKIDGGLHDVIVGATDMNGIELEDGAIKGVDTLSENLKGKYANYIIKTSTEGAKTDNPPAGNLPKFTHEDIAKMSADEINKNWEFIKDSL